MGFNFVSKDTSWWVFTTPAFLGVQGKIEGFLMLSLAVVFLFVGGFSAGGVAWRNGRNRRGQLEIPGPYGLPVFGNLLSLSRGLAHRTLASMAISQDATQLMAFSLGSTPVVVSSDPHTAREILTSPHFANRPIKQSAMMLMFSRAIGFAPNGTYWLRLRRIASSNLFAPKCIMAHEVGRQLDCTVMLNHIAKEQDLKGAVYLRKHLQDAALNNIMGIVFGKRYNMSYSQEAMELREIVREGFELLGAFNWSDHLPWLSYFYDPSKIKERCTALTPRVTKLVQTIIKEHKNNGSMIPSDNADFVDILLALDGEEKLEDNDMIAVLWEMIFRGTDTVALLTEWVMAELILNPDIQTKLQQELDCIIGNRNVTTADTASLPYLQAVVTETLRVHPPGPLLSWCRYSSSDVLLSNGMLIPANTTAMVNMWAISHDSNVWDEPLVFKPERFIKSGVDVRGNGLGLRLAPFGAGARMCPGKSLGLATVNLWVAKLVQNFKWVPNKDKPIELSEVLKLSCQMKKPLSAMVVRRDVV